MMPNLRAQGKLGNKTRPPHKANGLLYIRSPMPPQCGESGVGESGDTHHRLGLIWSLPKARAVSIMFCVEGDGSTSTLIFFRVIRGGVQIVLRNAYCWALFTDWE